MRRTARVAFALALALLPLLAQAQGEPSFLLETIAVEGGTAAAARIVVAESRLQEGQTAGEPELRDAMARIQRLPFVLSADFRLAKGSEPGRYVLVIVIRPMSRLFLNAGVTTTWSIEERRGRTPFDPVTTFLDQRRTSNLTVGGRAFVGRKGMLTLAAERVEHRNDRFTLAFTQYDLFGTRASLTAVVTAMDNPGAIRSDSAKARNDWHFRDNFAYELIGVVPLGRNDSLRASWERSYYPIRYVQFRPDGIYPILRSLPGIRKELFWIHDTTNDPLFPTSGTRITAGAIRTSMPTSGSTLLGRVKIDEYRATLEHSWPVTRSQALTLGASGYEFDRRIDQYRAFARYSVDLWSRERTLRWGDLRFELEGDRFLSALDDQYSAESTARAGFAYRTAWGVLRMNFQYTGWRQPEP